MLESETYGAWLLSGEINVCPSLAHSSSTHKSIFVAFSDNGSQQEQTAPLP